MGWYYRHFRLDRYETEVSLDIPLTVPSIRDKDGDVSRRYIGSTDAISLDHDVVPSDVTITYAPSDITIIRAYCIVTAKVTKNQTSGKVEITDGTTAIGELSLALGADAEAGAVLPIVLSDSPKVAKGAPLKVSPTKFGASGRGSVAVVIEYMM